jgi:hypothetical protein
MRINELYMDLIEEEKVSTPQKGVRKEAST